MSEENIEINEEIIEACEIERPVRVLMVVTSADKIGKEEHKTGVWFEEFAVPYLDFLKEGYFVTQIDKSYTNTCRQVNPELKNRRIDLYRKWL